MSDKDLIISLLGNHGAKIAKVLFPKMPIQAIETLLILGIKNKATDPKITQAVDFLFDADGNLPEPEAFWDVMTGVLDDKPIEFDVFKQRVIINGGDIQEIKKSFNSKKVL